MTGECAQYFSTTRKATANTALVTKRPAMRGDDHGISSVVFKLKPSNRLPTMITNVIEPPKSIRRSFSFSGRLWTSEGSTMLTFQATNTKLKMRMGIWTIL